MSLPAGLRVLVVDTDSECLKILEKMLIKCKYIVKICNSAKEALDLLEKGKEGFDIVLTDVNLPDMDGFVFIEQVGIKMDLPVIVMSLDQETGWMKKGFQHGACEFLHKPIKLWELRNIWKHVFKKRVHDVKQGNEGKENVDQTPIPSCGIDNSNESCSSFGGDDGNTRSGDDGKKREDNVDRPSSVKKPRVAWTNELHQSFVKAVNRVGLDKAGPKKILDLMGVPWLTRENVASHLQKYRLYLSRKQEKDLASGGMMFSENTCLQSGAGPSSLTLQQNIVINENYVAPKHELHINSHSDNLCEGNVMSLPMQAEAEKVAADHYTWSDGGTSSIQNRQRSRPYFQFDHYPHVSHIHGSSRRETNHQPLESNINHFYNKKRSIVTGNTGTTNLLPIPQQSHLTNCHTLEPAQCSLWGTKIFTVEQQSLLHNNLEASLNNMTFGTGSSHDMELNAYSFSTGDMYLQSGHLGDARSELYDPHNIEGEYGNNNHTQMIEGEYGNINQWSSM